MNAKPRIVIASPDRAEVTLLADWLIDEGLDPVPVLTLPSALGEVQARPFDVLIADALFAFEGRLQAVARGSNPRAPLVVLGGVDAGAGRRGSLHVGRPVDQALLLCHVAMAIAEGRPTRRSERKRIEPFEAVVEGVDGSLIDISDAGLRLELPRGRVTPPPYFTVRVPLFGIAIGVRRVWMAAAPSAHADVSWCGCELFQTPSRAEQKWRALVSTLSSR